MSNVLPADKAGVVIPASKLDHDNPVPADVRAVKARTPATHDENVGFVISTNSNGAAADPRRHKVTYDRRVASGFLSTANGVAHVVGLNEDTNKSPLPLRSNQFQPFYAKSLHYGSNSSDGLGTGSETLYAYFPASQGPRSDLEWTPPDPSMRWDESYTLDSLTHIGAANFLRIDGAKKNTIKWEDIDITQASYQMRHFIVTGLDSEGQPTAGTPTYLQSIAGNGALTFANTPTNRWVTSTTTELELPANWLGAAATSGVGRYVQIRPRNSNNILVKWIDAPWLFIQNRAPEADFQIKDTAASAVLAFTDTSVDVRNNTAVTFDVDIRYMLANRFQLRRAEGLPPADDDFSGVTFQYLASATGSQWRSTSSTTINVTPTEGNVELGFAARFQPDNKTYFYQARPVETSSSPSRELHGAWERPYIVTTRAS